MFSAALLFPRRPDDYPFFPSRHQHPLWYRLIWEIYSWRACIIYCSSHLSATATGRLFLLYSQCRYPCFIKKKKFYKYSCAIVYDVWRTFGSYILVYFSKYLFTATKIQRKCRTRIICIIINGLDATRGLETKLFCHESRSRNRRSDAREQMSRSVFLLQGI